MEEETTRGNHKKPLETPTLKETRAWYQEGTGKSILRRGVGHFHQEFHEKLEPKSSNLVLLDLATRRSPRTTVGAVWTRVVEKAQPAWLSS